MLFKEIIRMQYHGLKKAVAKGRLPFAADLQVSYSLAQCYFQTGRYNDVIATLENYRDKASKTWTKYGTNSAHVAWNSLLSGTRHS